MNSGWEDRGLAGGCASGDKERNGFTLLHRRTFSRRTYSGLGGRVGVVIEE